MLSRSTALAICIAGDYLAGLVKRGNRSCASVLHAVSAAAAGDMKAMCDKRGVTCILEIRLSLYTYSFFTEAWSRDLNITTLL